MPRQYTPKVALVCETCGVTFYRQPWVIRKTGARFCSRACVNVIHRASVNYTYTVEYTTWRNIHGRCNNRNFTKYADYGGRGITVCRGWSSYKQFLDDMGPRPPKHEIDRIDNDSGYWCGHCSDCVTNNRPANCRWATRVEQMNNLRKSRIFEFDGLRLTATQWSRRLGINLSTIYNRFQRGWAVEDILYVGKFTPESGPRRREGSNSK